MNLGIQRAATPEYEKERTREGPLNYWDGDGIESNNRE